MPSRMERYYEASEDGPSRTRKNQELYNQIYEEKNFDDNEFSPKKYTNVSGFAETPDSNTVDIQKIREMINSREEKNKEKNAQIYDEIKEEVKEETEEPKNYDINDVLDKAKDERPIELDDNYHSLKNVELNILKNLNIGDKKDETKEVLSDNTDELPELLNTITNTSMLNKLGDKELSLDLLGDLKSNGTTMIGTSDTIKNVLEESKKKDVKDETTEIDKSFFTKSLDLKDSLKLLDGEDEEESESKKLKVVVTIIVIAALLVVGVALYLVFKK